MNKILILMCAVLVITGIFLVGRFVYAPIDTSIDTSVQPIVSTATVIESESVLENADTQGTQETHNALFENVIIETDNPGAELVQKFGLNNVFTLLAINRVDDRNLMRGMSLVVPTSFDDSSLWEFMPAKIAAAETIPKLVVVSQRTQAFGFYENGVLVRSGPVSSGKQSTPTGDGLYFTNWKGKEVISTFSDEWILKWNFNINNKGGISLHQYALPGYPASHSCVRLYEEDARWLYDWADQWVLAPDGQTMLARGTPVIIYGMYDFDQEVPWKRLVEDTSATKVPQTELEDVVSNNLSTIQEEWELRQNILSDNNKNSY